MNRIVFHDRTLVVTVPHKCGSTSFQAATVPGLAEVAEGTAVHVGDAAVAYWRAVGIGPLSFADVFRLYPNHRRITAVRCPVQRFLSTWDDFCLRRRVRGDWDWMRGTSPEEFLSLIESCPGGNAHWYPQSFITLPDSEFIRSDWLLRYLELPEVRVHTGEREGTELNEDMLARLRVLYPRDFQMWDETVERGLQPPEPEPEEEECSE